MRRIAIAVTSLIVASLAVVLFLRHRDQATTTDTSNEGTYKEEARASERAFAGTLDDLKDFEHATKVTLYRIANPMEPDFSNYQGRPKAAGYPILATKSVSPMLARQLVRDLRDRKHFFEPGNGWTCLWEPGFVVELTRGTHTSKITICLKCGDVAFEPSLPKADSLHSLNNDGHSHISDDLYKLWPESFPPKK